MVRFVFISQWRKKPAHEKQIYEEKAIQLNLQNRQREALNAAGVSTPSDAAVTPKSKSYIHHDVDIITATTALKKDPDWIFECCWAGCDWQFEDALDLIEHCTEEPKGHVAMSFKDVANTNGNTRHSCFD